MLAMMGMYSKVARLDKSTVAATFSGGYLVIEEITIVLAAIGAMNTRFKAL